MSGDRPGDEPREPSEDPLARDLVPEPSDLPDVKLVLGFVGRGETEGSWRIYLTAEFDHFVEVNVADIVRAKKLDPDDDEFGGSAVWIRKSARVRQSRTRTREVQARFLDGAIASRFTRSASGGFSPFGGPRMIANRSFGCGGTIGSFLSPPCAYAPHHTSFISCVPEFCEFVPATWLPDEVACTWEAECP